MVVKQIVVGNVAYEICMNTAAMYKLEELQQEPVENLLARMRMGQTGSRDMLHILLAMLEGARARALAPDRGPWTLNDVFRLVDVAGGPEKLFDPRATDGNLNAMLECWRSAYPQRVRVGEEVDPNKLAPQDRPITPTGATTGTPSSAAPKKRGSRKTRTGV